MKSKSGIYGVQKQFDCYVKRTLRFIVGRLSLRYVILMILGKNHPIAIFLITRIDAISGSAKEKNLTGKTLLRLPWMSLRKRKGRL